MSNWHTAEREQSRKSGGGGDGEIFTSLAAKTSGYRS